MQICWRTFSRRAWNNFWEPTLILKRTSNLPARRPGAYANCSLPFVNCFGPSCFVAWRGQLLQNTPSCSCVNLCSVSMSIILCDSVLPLLRQGNAFTKLHYSFFYLSQWNKDKAISVHLLTPFWAHKGERLAGPAECWKKSMEKMGMETTEPSHFLWVDPVISEPFLNRAPLKFGCSLSNHLPEDCRALSNRTSAFWRVQESNTKHMCCQQHDGLMLHQHQHIPSHSIHLRQGSAIHFTEEELRPRGQLASKGDRKLVAKQERETSLQSLKLAQAMVILTSWSSSL